VSSIQIPRRNASGANRAPPYSVVVLCAAGSNVAGPFTNWKYKSHGCTKTLEPYCRYVWRNSPMWYITACGRRNLRGGRYLFLSRVKSAWTRGQRLIFRHRRFYTIIARTLPHLPIPEQNKKKKAMKIHSHQRVLYWRFFKFFYTFKKYISIGRNFMM